ncbi:hypothetical protein C8J56DRAFT_145077 [Mycena floridula]|nr:hypothetical protein C8J56DRAFT_145077 [Mycena floridula]
MPVAIALGDIVAAIQVTVAIINALRDGADASSVFRELSFDLESLQGALVSVGKLVSAYESSELSESLASSVEREVNQCSAVLRKLAGRLFRFREPLVRRGVGMLWKKVWWAVWEEKELQKLQRKLHGHERRLTTLLVAFNSVQARDLGTEMRIGFVSIQTIARRLERAPSVSRFTEKTITVLDVLGAVIPVPISFCSSWEAFNHIVQSYFIGRKGQKHVANGRYVLFDKASNRLVDKTSFREDGGTELEMILLLDYGLTEQRCTKCGRMVLAFSAVADRDTRAICSRNKIPLRWMDSSCPSHGLIWRSVWTLSHLRWCGQRVTIAHVGGSRLVANPLESDSTDNSVHENYDSFPRLALSVNRWTPLLDKIKSRETFNGLPQSALRMRKWIPAPGQICGERHRALQSICVKAHFFLEN